MSWWMVDGLIMLAYGLQHSLLTTKTAVNLFNKVFPSYLWNIIYSAISVLTLVVGFNYWQTSGVYIFYFTPGSLGYHIMLVLLASSLFFFFYCFKYTTSFWQWLGVKQVALKAMNKPMPAYYKIRQNGIKRYIRFPHHTCLIFFFWTHPVMTLDTLFLAIGATIYLYMGTAHQDTRGMRIIGEEWREYRKNTCLLLPGPKVIAIMLADFKAALGKDAPKAEDREKELS